MQVLLNPGFQFVVQAVFHGLVAAVVVEGLLKAWEVSRPGTRVRFHLLVLILPLLAWPLFQLIDPSRGSSAFRSGPALIDLNAWMGLRVLGVSLLWPFLAVLSANTAVFFLEELAPALRQRSRLLGSARRCPTPPRVARAVAEVARRFGVEWGPGDVSVVTAEEPVAYTAGLWRQHTVVSRTLVDMLDDEELEAVLAHELAHRQKRDNAAGWLGFAAMGLAFYSPPALFALRLIAHDRELACDELAARMTRRPLALASAIVKVSRRSGGAPRVPDSLLRLSPAARFQALGYHGRRALLEERISRLTAPSGRQAAPWATPRLVLTAAALLALLFFVV